MRVAVLLGLLAQSLSPAADWREFHRHANEAIRAGDYARLKEALLALQPLAPGNARNMYNLAAAQARLGDPEAALAGLQSLTAAGLSYDLKADEDFAKIAARPEFAVIVADMERNGKPITHSHREATLSEPDLIPESIVFDQVRKRFLVSSVRRAKIISAADGKPFAQTDWPVFAIAIDPQRRLLWASTAWMAHCENCSKSDDGKGALLAFDLASGRLMQRIDSPVKGVLGDMTISRNGSLYISDGVAGAVFVLEPGARVLARIDQPGEFASPQTAALSADEKTLYVPDYIRGIAAINLTSRQVNWLKPAPGIVLSGIDGLYLHAGKLLAIQNGTHPVRIVEFSQDLRRQRVWESGWPGLGEPTHGVLVGGTFFYLTNTGWDKYDAKGVRKSGPPVESAVYRLKLR